VSDIKKIQGSLHCGGKSAAFGRDDVDLKQQKMHVISTGAQRSGETLVFLTFTGQYPHPLKRTAD
jgi:hypothetical protein